MADLDQFFVSLGVKGQNVVLKNIDKVKKEAKSLSKIKSILDFGKGKISKALSKAYSPASISGVIPKQQQPEPSPEQEKRDKKEDRAVRKFSDSANRFSNASQSIANSAASLDPVGAIQAITSATAKIAGGWSAFGFSAGNTIEGVGDLLNAGISMANSAVEATKQSSAQQYALAQRNVTTEYYGGGAINKGGMTNPEHAQLTMRIAGAFGRVQKPMAEALNKLVNKKDTNALAAVAGGDWESTGTDKGFMLQQIINSTQGMLPSISQKIQTELLKSNADLIQDKSWKSKESQSALAGWVRASESQTANLFKAGQANLKNLQGLNDKFNKIQVDLTKSGASLAACVDKMANSINGAVDKIKTNLGK